MIKPASKDPVIPQQRFKISGKIISLSRVIGIKSARLGCTEPAVPEMKETLFGLLEAVY